MALVAVAGMTGLRTLGRGEARALVDDGAAKTQPMAMSAQAGTVEIAAKVAHGSDVAAELATHVRLVGWRRLYLVRNDTPFTHLETWLDTVRTDAEVIESARYAGWHPERLADAMAEGIARAESSPGSYFRDVAVRSLAAGLADLKVSAEARDGLRAIHVPDTRAEAQRRTAISLARAGLLEEARELLEEAGASALAVKEPFSRTLVQRGIAATAVQIGLREEALAALAEASASAASIDGDGRRLTSLLEVVGDLWDHGFQDEARASLEDARGWVHSSKNRYEVMTAQDQTAVALALTQQAEEARKVAASIPRVQRRAEAQHHVAMALVEAGLPEDAKVAFAEAAKSGAKIKDVLQLLNHQTHLATDMAVSGFVDDAKAMFAKARRTTASLEYLSEHAIAQRTLARSLAKANMVDEAREVVAAIDDEWQRGRTRREVNEIAARWADAARSQVAPNLIGAAAVQALSADGTWVNRVTTVPGPDLREWGAALAEQWERFTEAPAEAFSKLVAGAVKVASTVFSLEEEGRWFEWLRNTPALDESARAEVLSHTRLPWQQAVRSVRSMGLPAARMATRGLLVTSLDVAEKTLDAVTAHDPPHALDERFAMPRSAAALRKLFEEPDASHTLLTLKNFAKFTPDMQRELGHLMDNHPEVFVIGVTKNPDAVDPLLREKGRFGAMYQQ